MLWLHMHMASHVPQHLSLGVIPRLIILPPVSVSVLSLEVVMAHLCWAVYYSHLAHEDQGVKA